MPGQMVLTAFQWDEETKGFGSGRRSMKVSCLVCLVPTLGAMNPTFLSDP